MYEKIKRWFLKNYRKAGMYISFGLTSYKAFDYRAKYLNEVNINDVLKKVINERRDENDELLATYNNVLLNIAGDNYTMNDIKLPLWFQIYDNDTNSFKMIKFNKAYENMYGNDPSKYFAKTNEYIAGEIGKEWEVNNNKVLGSKDIHFFYERYVDKDGKTGIGRFAKWVVEKNGNRYIYGLQIEL